MTWFSSSLPLLAARGSNAALITFLLYTLAVFGIAWASNRLMQGKSFLSEYFLGSRSLGVWAFALTFAATSASGGTFTGFPSKVYTHGWILALWIGSYMVVPICTMGLLGKRLNQVARITGAITVPDVLRDRFRSPGLGLLAVSLIVFFMTFNLVGQFKAGSVILNTLLQDVPAFKMSVGWLAAAKANLSLFGLDRVDAAYLLCLVVFAVAVIIYTTWGGFHAVVWTDVMQGVVMVVGVMVMLPLALNAVGGLKNATEEMARMTPPHIGLAELHLETPPAENFTLVSPWFSAYAEDDKSQRLYRVNQSVTFPAGETSVSNVKVVGLTTQEEIDRQIQALQQAGPVEFFNGRMVALKKSQIRWLERRRELHPERGAEFTDRITRLQHEVETIDTNTHASLTGSSTGISPIVTLDRKYRYGADRPGTYVSGPGPVPSSLPQNPGTLIVRVNQIGAKVETLRPDGTVADMRRAPHVWQAPRPPEDHSTVRITLSAGTHRIRISQPAMESVTREVTIAAEQTQEIEVELPPSAGGKPDEAAVTEVDSLRASGGFLPLSLAVSFFFMWSISGSGQPSNMVRLMAFRDAKTLRRAMFTVSIYFTLIYFPLVIIFCCSRVLLPGMDLESDRIMPQMAVTLTDTIGQGWLAGLLIAAPFAAVMSTVDSFLLMISSAIVRDIYQRNLRPDASEQSIKRLCYLSTLAVGVGAMLGAVNPPQFLQDIIVYTTSGLAACFLAPVAYGLYWPRANLAGGVAAMIGGFLAHFSMYLAGSFLNGSFYRPWQPWDLDPILIGLVASFATGYVVTKLTAPPPGDLVQRYFLRPTARSTPFSPR